MARTTSSPILQMIRRVVADPRVRCCTDQELRRRFLEQHDEAAFETLVHRHGPMVLDVCRGLLPNEADVEDAFQATFLILARKGNSIRKAASLGCWLHGVAYRTACKARTDFARRRKHEGIVPAPAPSEAADELTWREVRQVVHEELNALSERYRAPLVLCYLGGQTQESAAALLGLARSTLKDRLERGRAILRARLVRRGFGPAAVLIAGAWPAAAATAGLPPALVAATVQVVTLVSTGGAATSLLSARVGALSEKAMKAVFLTRLRSVAGLLLTLGVIGAGAVGLVSRSLGTSHEPAAGATRPSTVADNLPQAQAAPPIAPEAAPDRESIERLIRQLGSDDFQEREAASNALKKVGKPALKALREAATENADPEVRRRAAALIHAIRDSLIRSLDLGPHANQKLNERFHNYREGNDLAALPTGRQSFAGIAFTVGEGVVQVGGEKPGKVEGIKVDAKVVKLHFLHACGFSGNIPRNTPIGKYVVQYDDRTTEEIEIVYGRDVVDWWVQPGVADPTRGKVAWEGQNAFSPIKLFLTTWENPNPTRRIVTLDYVATGGTPFCVAISAEN